MNERFEVLDAFRGICAISVVVFHMSLVGSITEWAFFRGSSIFVEFFFVLSGFVLAHSYGSKKNLNFKIFMKNRFFRLYPLHFFMFSIFILLEVANLVFYKFGFSFRGIPFSGKTGISEIIPNLLLLQSWFPSAYPLSFNGPSWSISVEFYMYAILFLTIVFFKKHKWSVWLCISITSFFLIYFHYELLPNEVMRGLSCFFGGAFTYVVYKKLATYRINYLFGSFIELILIISVVYVVQSSLEYKSIIAPALFIIVIFSFAYESGFFSLILKKKLFQRIGVLSFSIYMTHYVVVILVKSLAVVMQKITGINLAPVINGGRYIDFGSATLNNVFLLSIILFVIIVSRFTYKNIEIKGQISGKKYLSNNAFSYK